MIFTERIQKSVGRVVLHRNYKKIKRVRYINNLNTAETIGVVFSPANKNELNEVKKFLAYLSNMDIKVVPLAIMETKKSNIEMVMEQNINFVDRKDFNWFHKPLTPVLKDFIQKEFDILISLYVHKSLASDFIISQSRAKLKTGKYFGDKETFYDLMIDINESNNLSFLIEQTSHYLSVINNTK